MNNKIRIKDSTKIKLVLTAIRSNRFLAIAHPYEVVDGEETCMFIQCKEQTQKNIHEMNKVENFKTILELNFIHHKMQEMRHFDSICECVCAWVYLHTYSMCTYNTELMINR